ncbi:MAG TPA: AraC family transcriptional regulator [Verrucomicrobiae bacterium]|jgi:AraC-like DNA-binding protein
MKETHTIKPAAPERSLPLKEADVWRPLPGGWRQLYGGFHDLGISIEWHDFETAKPFEWSRSFHPGSLELCLNLSGNAVVRCGADSAEFGPLTAGFYVPGRGGGLTAWRKPGERHRFITAELSPLFLRGQLSQCDGALHPMVEHFMGDAARARGLGAVHRLTSEQEHWVQQLLRPPTALGARLLWYHGKALQLLAEFLFDRAREDELFCDRQKRVARERVDKVAALLRANLAQPPDLEELGRKAGCSSFHLSRTFSRELGMTIPQYSRKLRMERAAELLRSGKYNVTEAAMAVGYSSLSHFSQAFCQAVGCCPGLYPLKEPAPQSSDKE